MIKSKKKVCGECGEESFIWANRGGRKLCKKCATTGVDIKPTYKAKPIAPRSQKRAIQEREYSTKRKAFLDKHPMCQAHLPQICTTVSTDVHHMKGRIGNLLLDETHWLSVCRGCHYWIEMRPEAAKELGFSIKRLT
jgi:ribosomal protein S27AE